MFSDCVTPATVCLHLWRHGVSIVRGAGLQGRLGRAELPERSRETPRHPLHHLLHWPCPLRHRYHPVHPPRHVHRSAPRPTLQRRQPLPSIRCRLHRSQPPPHGSGWRLVVLRSLQEGGRDWGLQHPERIQHGQHQQVRAERRQWREHAQ